MSKYKVVLHNDNRASFYVKDSRNETSWRFIGKYHNLEEATRAMKRKASEEHNNGVVIEFYYNALGQEEEEVVG